MILPFPGSKTNAARDLLSFAGSYAEYRDVFCGNASMLWSVPTTKTRWVNDCDPDQVAYLRALKSQKDYIDEIMDLRDRFMPATADEQRREFAIRKLHWWETGCPVSYWFCRCLSHGQIFRRSRSDLAAFSRTELRTNFTQWTRERVESARRILQGVKITNTDYSALLDEPGENVLAFIDPPYYITTHGQPLYEHELTKAQHIELYERLCACCHPWILTINICGLTHKLYEKSGRFRVSRMEYGYCGIYRPSQPRRYEYVITPR